MYGEFTWHTTTDVSRPVDGRIVLLNWWWPTNDKGEVLFYEVQGRIVVQASTSKDVAKAIACTRQYKTAGCTGDVIQIPMVYVEHRCY